MIKLLRVYSIKRSPKLRAKLQINGKTLTVHCGKEIPQYQKGAWISEISREDGRCHIDINTGSGVLRVGKYSLKEA